MFNAFEVSFGRRFGSDIGSLSSFQLGILYLDGNDLSGEIPSQLGSAVSLTELLLNDNQLAGEVPSTLSQLSLLGKHIETFPASI